MHAKPIETVIFLRQLAVKAVLVVVLFVGAATLRTNAQLRDLPYVTARTAAFTPRVEAFGQVAPIAALPVNAAEEGIVTGLRVVPGGHVRGGETLAHLSGPSLDSALRQGQADVRSARAQLDAARKYLTIVRQQLPSHLSTRAAVQQAESAAAQAQTSFENAESRLRLMQQMATLSAPAEGVVLAINASNGQLVSAGQPVVTLQSTGELWLKAAYYGADLSQIRVGMAGSFAAADGSAPIRVRVRSISGTMSSGGETVALVNAAGRVRWINGEFGKVTLDLPPRQLVKVPTRALILDRGRWWVLIHDRSGDHPQQVVPGPSRGWDTFLKSGLRPGSQVVVENAYLQFHRGIGERYQPPDQ
jgi:RND family efflux transporter MFP subunit